MSERLNYNHVAPAGAKALGGVYGYVVQSGLPATLVALAYLRVSQINNCAYCLDMHSKDARALGETEQRLYLLDAWEESPFYSERERAALALTDAVTKITEGHVPDAVWEHAKSQFSEAELTALVITITTINAWNRLAITARVDVGSYQPKMKQAQTKSA